MIHITHRLSGRSCGEFHIRTQVDNTNRTGVCVICADIGECAANTCDNEGACEDHVNHMCVLVNRGTLGRNMNRVNQYNYIIRYITTNSRYARLFSNNS